MKNIETNTNWTFILMTISTIMVAFFAITSMNHYSFTMTNRSEEAGIAFIGSPFKVLQSESVFYAGYVGQLATTGGSDYIEQALGENPSFKFLPSGIIANAIWYSLVLLSLNALILYRRHLLNIAANLINKNGVFIGIVKIVVILATIIVLLQLVLYLAFSIFYQII